MAAPRLRWTPGLAFVVSAALLAAVGAFSMWQGSSDPALDIPIHDTYFVVAAQHVVVATVVYCLACALIYPSFHRLLHRPLNAWLGLAHALLTVIGLWGFLFPLYGFHGIALMDTPRRYYDYTEFSPDVAAPGSLDLGFSLTGHALVFLLGQSLLVVNIVRSLLTRPQQ